MKQSGVVAFPVFERYGEQIREWLSTLNDGSPGRRTLARIARQSRCMASKAGSVRNSPRHANLAGFLRLAANALDEEETDGARYLLMTALALMGACAAQTHTANPVIQFPAAAEESTVAADAATGIAAG